MEDTLEDFLQKYRNTYSILVIGDKEILSLCKGTNDDNEMIFYSEEAGSVLLSFESAKKQIRQRFPETGLYNIGKTFAMFTRKPERQFKRCPADSNCKITDIFTEKQYGINFVNLKECFTPSYPKTKKEAQVLANTRGGVALNRMFGITIGDDVDYTLWLWDKPVGIINQDKVTVLFDPVRQEVTDYFKGDVWTN